MRSARARLSEQERLASRAHDRAAAAENHLARLVEALDFLPVGIVVSDDRGHELARNRRASSAVGDIQSDVLIARALEELLMEGRTGARHERTLELYGPPARSVRISVEPLPSGGAVAVVEDASLRRQLDAVRRDFVANVNHELRTPVGALGVLADALAGERDIEVIQRLAARVSAEAERARALIEEILEFSSIEANRAAPHQPVWVAALLEAAVERVLALSERRGVPVRVVEPAEASVTGNRAQLISAVVNLLDNAIKYSETGAAVEVGVMANGASVDITVRDRGIGIPARDLDRIFERFYRVDRARGRRTGGSGLGLAIVRHVASNHSGEVLVESREGEGSTFTLRLPRTP
jgi:two-component system sensor histidine kinase SenX3